MRIYQNIFSLNYNLQVMDEKIEKSQPFIQNKFFILKSQENIQYLNFSSITYRQYFKSDIIYDFISIDQFIAILTYIQSFISKQIFKLAMRFDLFLRARSFEMLQQYFTNMFNFVRKVVGGPKNRLVSQDFDLDLTYITQRVIAMAFPASGLQTTYRNSIDDVAKFLQKNHNENFLVINLSMRKYDYKKFGGKVKDYFWPDHQAPPLQTIFTICKDMKSFLQKSKTGVVAVHCNHGKGRTGTAIVSFLLYTGFYNNSYQALNFYNKKRFTNEQYGVDQPCQKRIINFFQVMKSIKKLPTHLKAFKLKNAFQQGLDDGACYIQISTTKDQTKKYLNVPLYSKNKISLPNVPVIGDIFIQVYEKKWPSDKQITRMNYHTQFLPQDPYTNEYVLQVRGWDVKVCSGYPKNFKFILIFQQFCECHKITENSYIEQKCQCLKQRSLQEISWEKMKIIIEQSNSISKKKACDLLFIHHLHMKEQEIRTVFSEGKKTIQSN